MNNFLYCKKYRSVKETGAKYYGGVYLKATDWNSILFALAAAGIHASELLRKVMATIRFSETLKASDDWNWVICRVFTLCGAYPHNLSPNS